MNMKIKGETPIVSRLKAEQTAQAIRARAQAEDRIKSRARNRARNQRRKAQREVTEARIKAEPRTEPEAEAEARADTLYYIGNNYGINRHIVNNIIKTEEETEPVGKAEALTNKDFITLYYSNVLILGKENPREKDPKDQLQENEIIKFLKHLNPLVRLNQRVKTPFNDLVRLSYSINEANTPQALKYLLTFKGKAERVTNTQTNEIGKIKPILSYNFIGYEPNKIIIYGEKTTIKAIEKRFNKLNSIENGYYDFIGEEDKKARIKRELKEEEETERKATIIRGTRAPKQRNNMLHQLTKGVKKDYFETADTEKKAELINRALFYEIKLHEFKAEVTAKVRGINNLKEEEKTVTKKLREAREPNKEFIEILEEVKEALRKADGRQGLINLEYDIKKSLKWLKNEKEYTIFKLYKLIEDSKLIEAEEEGKRLNEDLKDLEEANIILKANKPELTASIVRNNTEIEEIKAEIKEIKAESEKKRTALLNVLFSIKQIIEEKKAVKQSIEEELKEAEKGNEFKAQKKNKNKYSTQYGIQRGNGNPQTTHKRILNKIPLNDLRTIKTEEEKAIIGLRNLKYLAFMAELEIKAEKKAEETRKRKEREAKQAKLIEEDLIFYYGEKAVKENLKILLKEHEEDYKLNNLFVTANKL